MEKHIDEESNVFSQVKQEQAVKLFSKKYNLKYVTTHLDCEICSKRTGKQNLKEKFVELTCDSETEDFITMCHTFSYFYLLKKSIIKPILLKFYSLPDANGMLGSGRMFLFSQNHLSIILDNQKFSSMLDIGAGDGFVTDKFKPYINGEITCIETAVKLQGVLKKKGFTIKYEIEGEYELVCLLNVLDRCENPETIMKQIHNVKKKLVLISIVLPFSGFYQEGTKKLPQKEKFCSYYKSFEESVNVINKKFGDLGFETLKISRLPYLSEGNMNKEMFFLDTAIFLLRNKENIE